MDSGWKQEVARAASLRRSGKGTETIAPLLERTGKPVSIRTARGSLFLFARRALAGQPLTMAIEEDAVVVLIALSDFVWILEERPETLAEGLASGGFKGARRGALARVRMPVFAVPTR